MPLPAALLAERVLPVLLRAPFANDKAAPLGSPLGVDVGTLTVTDATGVLSQSGGALVVNGTPAANSGIITPAAFARLAGRALLATVPSRTTVGVPRLGWDSASTVNSANLDVGIDISTTTAVRIKTVNTAIDSVTLGAGIWQFAFVMRATGGFVLARVGTGGPYTLLWVYAATTAAEYAKLQLTAASTHNFTLDDFRVVDFPYPWTDDYGIATTRLVSPSITGSFAHTPDAVLDYTFTYGTGLPCSVDYRIQDSGNCWRVNVNSTGATLALQEVVASVITNRGTFAAGLVNGTTHRVVVIAEGNVHKVYLDDVLRITYTDASNLYLTYGRGLTRLVSGGMAECAAWPRKVVLPWQLRDAA